VESTMTIIDAWMQHPTLSFLRNDMFASRVFGL
jgi:hypothetical protein